jgi:hypothetical protein
MLEMVHDSLWQNNMNQVHLKVWEYDGTIFLSAIEDDDDSGALPQGKDGESSIPPVVKTFIVMEQVALAATTIGIGKQAFVGSSRTTGKPFPSVAPCVTSFVCQHSSCPFLTLKLLTWPRCFP